MAGISAVSAAGSSGYYGQIASGRRINSAADDAAGLSISEKLKTEIGGDDAASANTKEGISAMNIADGALGEVTDYLQKIKELSVKASNGLMTSEDKSAIQSEISQYLDGIDQLTKNTQYNGLNLIDGSSDGTKIASNADGSGFSVSFGNSTTEALGISGYDVTGDFDMQVIDDAIAKVSSSRSAVGASTNAAASAYASTQNASYNLSSAESSLADLDIPKAVSDMKKQELLDEYSIMAQRQFADDEEKQANRLLAGLG